MLHALQRSQLFATTSLSYCIYLYSSMLHKHNQDQHPKPEWMNDTAALYMRMWAVNLLANLVVFIQWQIFDRICFQKHSIFGLLVRVLHGHFRSLAVWKCLWRRINMIRASLVAVFHSSARNRWVNPKINKFQLGKMPATRFELENSSLSSCMQIVRHIITNSCSNSN